MDAKRYKTIEDQWTAQWDGPIPTPKLLRVFEIRERKRFKSYNAYKNQIASKHGGDATERRRWHGTATKCDLIKNDGNLCDDTACAVCNICRTGFQLKFAHSGYFGKGLYFGQNPVKSHSYNNGSEKNGTKRKVIFLCKVVLGQMHKMPSTDSTLVGPPNGCDSVTGVGGSTHEEFIVYKEEAAIPAYLIFYEYT